MIFFSIERLMLFNAVFMLFTFLLFLISCADDPVIVQKKNKTILFYLAADNNLESKALKLQDIISESSVNDEEVNLIIYIDRKNSSQLLVREKRGNFRIIHSYEERNSVIGRNISDIIDYIIQTYPAEEMGLVLWSHGTSWLPTHTSNSRSFGYDKGEEGDIRDIASNLKIKFDYIIFDACYMGSIEVCSEFASKADYIVASPTIIPGDGIILPGSTEYLTSNDSINKRLKNICNKYYNYYSKEEKYVSISLVRTSRIKELADFIKMYPQAFYMSFLSEIQSFPIRQRLLFFDFKSTLETMYGYPIKNLINNVIIHYNSSTMGNCGLSIFILTNKNDELIKYYSQLKWNKLSNWLSAFR